MHNQLLSPLLNIFPFTPPPLPPGFLPNSLSHACLSITSPPLHITPDYIEKLHTLLQRAMGVHSISRILQHHLSSPPTPNPRWNPPITQLHEFTSRQVIIQYTYWLTLIHSGNFRDIPLIDVSVEGRSRIKHCRKKKRPITFTVNAQEKKAEGRTLTKILWQPNEGKPLSNYIHYATNTNFRINLLESQEHVQVTLCHPQTYVSTWCHNACWWQCMLVTHESNNVHTNPSVS